MQTIEELRNEMYITKTQQKLYKSLYFKLLAAVKQLDLKKSSELIKTIPINAKFVIEEQDLPGVINKKTPGGGFALRQVSQHVSGSYGFVFNEILQYIFTLSIEKMDEKEKHKQIILLILNKLSQNQILFFEDNLVTDAVVFGDVEVIKKLAEIMGPKVNQKSRSHVGPLWEAVLRDNYPIAEVLIQNKADVHEIDPKTECQLLHVAAQGKLEMIKLLLQNKADPKALNIDGHSPLILAVSPKNNHSLAIVKALCQGGADVNTTTKKGATLLMFASSLDCEDVVIYLCQEHKVFVNESDNEMHTAASYAVQHGAVSALKILIQQGADISLRSNDGRSLLMQAVIHKQLKVVCELLQQGSHVDEFNRRKEEETSLTLAVDAKDPNIPIIEILLQQKPHIQSVINAFQKVAGRVNSQKSQTEIFKLFQQYFTQIFETSQDEELKSYLQNKLKEFFLSDHFIDNISLLKTFKHSQLIHLVKNALVQKFKEAIQGNQFNVIKALFESELITKMDLQEIFLEHAYHSSERGLDPLSYALFQDYNEMAKYLISQGCPFLKCRGAEHSSQILEPWRIAILTGNIELSAFILSKMIFQNDQIKSLLKNNLKRIPRIRMLIESLCLSLLQLRDPSSSETFAISKEKLLHRYPFLEGKSLSSPFFSMNPDIIALIIQDMLEKNTALLLSEKLDCFDFTEQEFEKYFWACNQDITDDKTESAAPDPGDSKRKQELKLLEEFIFDKTLDTKDAKIEFFEPQNKTLQNSSFKNMPSHQILIDFFYPKEMVKIDKISERMAQAIEQISTLIYEVKALVLESEEFLQKYTPSIEAESSKSLKIKSSNRNARIRNELSKIVVSLKSANVVKASIADYLSMHENECLDFLKILETRNFYEVLKLGLLKKNKDESFIYHLIVNSKPILESLQENIATLESYKAIYLEQRKNEINTEAAFLKESQRRKDRARQEDKKETQDFKRRLKELRVAEELAEASISKNEARLKAKEQMRLDKIRKTLEREGEKRIRVARELALSQKSNLKDATIVLPKFQKRRLRPSELSLEDKSALFRMTSFADRRFLLASILKTIEQRNQTAEMPSLEDLLLERNAMLGIILQAMELIKDIKQDYAPISPEVAIHFRNVLSHALDDLLPLFVNDISSQRKFHDEVRELSKLLLHYINSVEKGDPDIKTHHERLFSNTLFRAINSYVIPQNPSLTDCWIQWRVFKAEAEKYRHSLRNPLILKHAIGFAEARMGAFAKEICKYPDEASKNQQEFAVMMAFGRNYRHLTQELGRRRLH